MCFSVVGGLDQRMCALKTGVDGSTGAGFLVESGLANCFSGRSGNGFGSSCAEAYFHPNTLDTATHVQSVTLGGYGMHLRSLDVAKYGEKFRP